MRYLLLILIFISSACKKDSVKLKDGSVIGWINFFSKEDIKSHYYISHLAFENDSILFSIFSCGDSCSIAGIQNSKIQSFNAKKLSSGDYKVIIIDSTKKIWYNQGLAISYTSNAPYCEQWVVSDLRNSKKSSKYKLDKNGNLWEASYKGLNCFNGEGMKTFFQNNNCYSICLDEQGNIYVNTLPENDQKGVILKYNYLKWDTIITCSKNADWVSSMCFDREDNLWFGVLNRSSVGIEYGGGLFKFKDNNIENYLINNSGIPSNSVVDIAIDNYDNKWIGTYNGGLAKYTSNNEWICFNKLNTDMPEFQSVEHIAIDKNNNIWLAIWWTGLAKLTDASK